MTTTTRSSKGNRGRSSSARTGLKRLAATSTSLKVAIIVIIQMIRMLRMLRMTRMTKSYGLQSGLLPQDVTTSQNPGRALLLPLQVMTSQLLILARRIKNGLCADSLNS